MPAPGTPSTMGRQVASGCRVARMASSSPVLKMRKKSSTSCSCGVRAVTMGLRLLRLIELGKRLARDAHPVDAGRHAAVDGDLQQHLANLLAGHTVVERRLDVQFQLMRAIQRADHRDVDETAIAQCEPGPRPHMTPAVLGREFLHRHAEFVGARHRAFHILGAQYLLAQLHPLVEFILTHGYSSLPPIRQPAQFSTTFTSSVQSAAAPCICCVIDNICRTAAPTTMGTPSASASSRHSRTSLNDSALANPKSNLRLRTCLGILSTVALLRPDEALSTSSIAAGSTPAFTPMASASAAMASDAADMRLLASLTV